MTIRQGEKRKFRERGTGTINKQNGYKFIMVNGKRIQEHRYIMEQFLGRKLDISELVHHKNHSKLDNRIENLEIVTRSDHKRIKHPEIGEKTRLQKKYNFNGEEIIYLYQKYCNTFKVAKFLGCSEITVRRALTIYLGKSLKKYRKERGWKYGYEFI